MRSVQVLNERTAPIRVDSRLQGEAENGGHGSMPLDHKMMLGATIYLIKRYIVYNAITWPISTAIWFPYNYFVLGYSTIQVKMWLVTGAFMGAIASVIMTYAASYAVHYADRHLKSPYLSVSNGILYRSSRRTTDPENCRPGEIRRN